MYGSVVTWGYENYGGYPGMTMQEIRTNWIISPTILSNVEDQLKENVKAIFSNGYAFVALKSDGSVVS